jgi:uncharacterized protein
VSLGSFLDSRSPIAYLLHGFLTIRREPMAGEMKIQIGGLSDGIHQYEFTVASSELELGEQFSSKVHVEATLDKSSNQILLTASSEATAHFECDRCVSPFERKLSASHTMVYVTEGMDAAHDVDPVEMQVIPSGLHVVDIAEDVRQSILLAVPFKNLCKEECKGLCPTCGTNLNESTCSCSEPAIDSRWEQLRKLQSN